jgi:hypothetical protein
MRKIDKLNPVARNMADALFGAFPRFQHQFEVVGKGDLRVSIPAPKGSKVHGLRVVTVNGEDTFVQLGVPDVFCLIDSKKELLQILKGLFADRLRFGMNSRRGKWTSTCILRGPEGLVLKRGEVGMIYSWTGAKDQIKASGSS